MLGDGKIYVSETSLHSFFILEPGDKECKTLHEHFFQAGKSTWS